jgi:hypothetical protein
VQKPHNSVLWHDTVIDWLKEWTGGKSGQAANVTR